MYQYHIHMILEVVALAPYLFNMGSIPHLAIPRTTNILVHKWCWRNSTFKIQEARHPSIQSHGMFILQRTVVRQQVFFVCFFQPDCFKLDGHAKYVVDPVFFCVNKPRHATSVFTLFIYLFFKSRLWLIYSSRQIRDRNYTNYKHFVETLVIFVFKSLKFFSHFLL